jgi:hypothetical protein
MYWSTDGRAARVDTVFFKSIPDFVRERELDLLLDARVGFLFEFLFLINSEALHNSYFALRAIS